MHYRAIHLHYLLILRMFPPVVKIEKVDLMTGKQWYRKVEIVPQAEEHSKVQ